MRCQFGDNEGHLVDAIICGTQVHRAGERLLQMPGHLTLQDCLGICCHWESLSYHLNVVRPKKPFESVAERHFARGGEQQQFPARGTGAFGGQPANLSTKTVPCGGCGMTHPGDGCPAC